MLTVETKINASIEKVWKFCTLPEHIVKWNFPNNNWHTPFAENDVKQNGKFKYTMKAKDGSEEFDFEGLYTDVVVFSLIDYKLFDDRTGNIRFEEKDGYILLTETFEPETQNSADMQRKWCQAVIDNFKNYVETN